MPLSRIVENKLLVAAFAVREINSAFEVRIRHYLDHFDKKLGLLANFHGERLAIRSVRIPQGGVPLTGKIHDDVGVAYRVFPVSEVLFL